jgi:hypothetical protein
MVRVNAARSDLPTPRSRALTRTAQQREQERVDRRRERNARRRERREQRSEEFRLREQQGLSSPGTEEYSSSDEEEEEEEEENRGQVLPDRWEPAPRHWSRLRWQEDHRLGRAQGSATEAARAVEALARATEAPTCVTEAAGGAAAAASAAP